ncbi:MAG: hypothetical protein NZL95_03680 [Chitinophagales bacterium]|nr:hypothetical protein [Chitinophagales bacterium]MDW8427630.1 hypothetical protein [Chitinophagales bacterium]
MAINKNHEFDELNGIKCAIVERRVSADRAAFLKSLLEANGYEVVVVPAGAKGGAVDAGQAAEERYDVGVTDVTFNAVNAVFGRMLRTAKGQVVTLAYWLQEQPEPDDSVPYFETPVSRSIGRS